jgi:Apea-like HEPN
MWQIVLNHSRSYGGYESLTSQKDLDVWRAIAASYSHVERTDRKWGPFTIDIDWSKRVDYARRYCALYQQSEDPLTALQGFQFEQTHTCPASIRYKSPSSAPSSLGWTELQAFLIDLFLIANLASPGSFNLYRSYIRDTSKDPAKDPLAQTDLDLSEHVFETAWHEARAFEWLKVGFIPFDTVAAWCEKLELNGKSAATTDVERTLFSLLHLGRASFMDPSAVLWLASALESLFDTPSGSSFSFLCHRIALLLDLSKEELAELRRRMRQFYDIRNAFVHGGARILHPLADDRDAVVQAEVSDLLATTNFAAGVLIGSVQELIRRNWRGLVFKEQAGPL